MTEKIAPERLAQVIESHDDFTKELARHDAAIDSLSNRMGGVEKNLRNLTDDVKSGFATISNALAKMEGSKGPSLGQILGVVATGGAIIAMSAGAITMLVSAMLSPQITRLTTLVEQHAQTLSLIEKEQRDEYRDLKRAAQRSSSDRVAELERRMSFTSPAFSKP